MLKIKNQLRNFDKYRKEKMQCLESILYKIINNRKYCQQKLLKKEEVKKIIIIRNNKRIGNMYFLIPFVKKTRELYPGAHITLMLNQPWQGDVFKNMGIDEICFSTFSFTNCFNLLSMLMRLRKEVYDLILMPNSSASDTCVCAFLSAKNKVSHFDLRRNIALTHCYQKEDAFHHMALSSLFLLNKITDCEMTSWDHFLNFSPKEINFGKNAYEKMVLEKNTKVTCFSIAYFRGARGDKLLSEAVWNKLLDDIETQFVAPIRWIEILSPDITTPLKANHEQFQSADMRHLGSFLKNVNAFICCDTGPLHLADAAGVNCIGLLNRTEPSIFGVLGTNSINIQGMDTLGVDTQGQGIDSFDPAPVVAYLNKMNLIVSNELEAVSDHY